MNCDDSAEPAPYSTSSLAPVGSLPATYHEVVVIPADLSTRIPVGMYHESVVISREVSPPRGAGVFHESISIPSGFFTERALRQAAAHLTQNPPTGPAEIPLPLLPRLARRIAKERIRFQDAVRKKLTHTEHLTFAALSGSIILVGLTIVGLTVAQYRTQNLRHRLAEFRAQQEATLRAEEEARIRALQRPLANHPVAISGGQPQAESPHQTQPTEIASVLPVRSEFADEQAQKTGLEPKVLGGSRTGETNSAAQPSGAPAETGGASTRPNPNNDERRQPGENTKTADVKESESARKPASGSQAGTPPAGRKAKTVVGAKGNMPNAPSRPPDDEIAAVRAALSAYFPHWDEIAWWRSINKSEAEIQTAHARLAEAREALEPDKRRYGEFLAQDFDQIPETPERLRDDSDYQEFISVRKRVRKQEAEISVLEQVVGELESQPEVRIGRIKYRIRGRKGSTTTFDQLYTVISGKVDLIDPKHEPKSLHDRRVDFTNDNAYHVKIRF